MLVLVPMLLGNEVLAATARSTT